MDNPQDPRVEKLDRATAPANAYHMARPVRFEGVLFAKGDPVAFSDPTIEALFLKNNYVTN